MDTFVSGTISVKAVLEEQIQNAIELWVNPKKRSRDIAYLIALAKQNQVPVLFKEAKEMNETAPSNGGVILFCRAMQLPALDPDEALKGLCVYVSGVEDPYNLGSIARSLYAAGAEMMILHQRDWTSAAATLMRSSAGAWARLKIYTVENDEQLIKAARRAGRDLYSAARNDTAVSLFETALPKDCLLCIGGAMRGLSSSILEASGKLIYIPYGREFRNALDSVGAAAVFAFAWTRENLNGETE